MSSPAFSAGAAAMRAQITAWHAKQGAQFADLAKKLERDRASPADIQRMKWAAASHNAHATAICRLPLPREPIHA